MRCAMMFRWISLVPPATVAARENMRCCAKRRPDGVRRAAQQQAVVAEQLDAGVADRCDGSAQNVLTIEVSAPGVSPRPTRVSISRFMRSA